MSHLTLDLEVEVVLPRLIAETVLPLAYGIDISEHFLFSPLYRLIVHRREQS